MKKSNQLAKTKLLKIFLSSIKTKVAIKFPKKLYFSAENRLGAERVKEQPSRRVDAVAGRSQNFLDIILKGSNKSEQFLTFKVKELASISLFTLLKKSSTIQR